MLIEDLRDATRLLHSKDKLGSLNRRAHRRITNRARPDRCNQRPNLEPMRGNLVGDMTQIRLAGIGIGVRVKQEVIDSVKLFPVHVGRCGKLEHVIQTNRRFLAFASSFTNKTWPHCVMKFQRSLRHRGGTFQKE